ncbi:hypothetical protein ACRZOU_004453, partial [Aeromonas salmonicida]
MNDLRLFHLDAQASNDGHALGNLMAAILLHDLETIADEGVMAIELAGQLAQIFILPAQAG